MLSAQPILYPPLTFSLVIVALFAPLSTAAQTDLPTARLQYAADGAVGCPSAAAFRDTVAGRLGYDPFQSDAQLTVEASILVAGEELSGTMVVRSAQGASVGERTIDAGHSDCTEIANALAIAISIFFDPLGTASVADPAHQAEQGQPTAPSETSPDDAPPAPVEPPLRPPYDERSSPFHPVLFAHLTGVVGLTPGVTLGPRVGGGLQLTTVSLIVEGRIDLMPAAANTDLRDRVQATVYSGGPGVCLLLAPMLGCAVVHLGSFHSRGVDVVDSTTQASFFASGDLRAGVDIPLGAVFSFQATAELRVPFIRTSMSIDGETVWNSPPVAGGLALGLAGKIL